MYHAVYSPRGFSNEFKVKTFSTLKELLTFKSEIDNDANSFTLASNEPKYQRIMREYRKQIGWYGQDEAEYCAYDGKDKRNN